MVQKQRVSSRARAQAALDSLLAEYPQLDGAQIRKFETVARLLARRFEGAELLRQLRRLLAGYEPHTELLDPARLDTEWMSPALRRRYHAEIERLLEMPAGLRQDYLDGHESWKGPLGLFYDSAEARQAFALLELEPPSSPDQIRQAYRRKARSLHPDLGGASEAFIHLQRAYRTALESSM